VTRYLLDTNVISELRKSRPQGAVLAWIESLRPEQILVSAVTVGEIEAGVGLTRSQNATKAREIEDWLTYVETVFAFLPMDPACFREWARLMAGKPTTPREDGMIAATAAVHGLTIATRDEKDFKQLGVHVVNPFKAT
jgi:predicted nucleic acid-binding protein